MPDKSFMLVRFRDGSERGYCLTSHWNSVNLEVDTMIVHDPDGVGRINLRDVLTVDVCAWQDGFRTGWRK